MENKILRKIKGMLDYDLDEYKLRTGESYNEDNYKDVIYRVAAVHTHKDLYMLVGRIKSLQELLSQI